MRNVAVLVEGQSEEAFIKQLLQAYVFDQQDSWLTPVVVETSRAASGQKRKGGGSWSHYLADIRKLLGSRHYAVVTTLIDFYGYPHDGPHAQCETAHGARACAREKARGMAAAVSSNRFLPFVLLHEFETLVLASSINRRTVLGDANAALCLQSHCAQVSNDVELLRPSIPLHASRLVSTGTTK